MAGTEVQRPGTSVPRRSPQRQVGSRLPALPAGEREEAACRGLGSPRGRGCEGTRDPQPGLPLHGAVPAPAANVLKRGGSFLGAFHPISKRIINYLFKRDQAQREGSSTAKERGRAQQRDSRVSTSMDGSCVSNVSGQRLSVVYAQRRRTLFSY